MNMIIIIIIIIIMRIEKLIQVKKYIYSIPSLVLESPIGEGEARMKDIAKCIHT